ncbi:MAG: glycosyltransferase family 2 protein [Candidatus Dormiibacterota bacterium]
MTTATPLAPQASIIVCTRNRSELLRDCIESLLQDSSEVAREVLVVDNGSSDDTAVVARSYVTADGGTPVRYVLAPRQGKSHALNLGVQQAAGALLLFTDDDVVVEDQWAASLCRAMEDEGVGVVGGRVRARWPQQPPPWLVGDVAAALGVRELGTEPKALEPIDVIGANMALRAADLRDIPQPFNPELGPSGKIKRDFEELHLVEGLGATRKLVYCPEAVVWHRIEADRMNRQWIRKMYFQRGLGRSRHDRLVGEPAAPWRERVRLAIAYYRVANSLRRHNWRKTALNAKEAFDEFDYHYWAAYHIESLLGHAPAVSGLVARVLA